MPLNGELSDLSLSELIEFFCNQRKTGMLEVTYLNGSIELYLQSGALVHAQIGVLRGVEAVYYALTQPNASFKFSPQQESSEQSINQPWSSVVLEGLRRMDEGITPQAAFPDEPTNQIKKVIEQPAPAPASIDRVAVPAQQAEKHETPKEIQPKEKQKEKELVAAPQSPAVAGAHKAKVTVSEQQPAKTMVEEKQDHHAVADRPEPSPRPSTPKRLPATSPLFAEVQPARRFAFGKLAAVAVAVVLLLAGVAVPWRWYSQNQLNLESERAANEAVPPVISVNSSESLSPVTTNDSAAIPNDATNAMTAPVNGENRHLESRRADNLRAKTSIAETPLTSLPAQPAAADPNQRAAKPQSSPSSAGAKKVTVQVTYDENGRVTQASGGDATALRIARQKRFPAGKPGSATVTIPIN